MSRVQGVQIYDFSDAIVGGGLDRDDPLGRHLIEKVMPSLWGLAHTHDVAPVVCHDLDLHRAVKDGDPLRAPLSAMIDPRQQRGHGPHDTAILALVRGGQVLATFSARLRWVDGTFNAAVDSGRLIYGADGRMPPGDFWHCTAPIGERIRDCPVAVGGGIWSDRVAGAKDPILLPLLCRLMIVWLLAEWRWTYFVGFSIERLAVLYGFPVYGAETVEHGMIVRQSGAVIPTKVVAASRARYREMVARPEFLNFSRGLDGFGAVLDRVSA